LSRTLDRIEVVEDRTADSRCDEGFLRVRRLRLRNHYEDGTRSEPYACDVVSRRHVDAVAVVLYGEDENGAVLVALRRAPRAPVLLRADKSIPHDDPPPRTLVEIVAGVLESQDETPDGVEARAAAECGEEAGYGVEAGDVRGLGAPLFPSPGVTDERVHFRRVRVDLEARGPAHGDGSVMEEAGEVVLLPLREAIRRSRAGTFGDMKTEVGLLRLADALGYVPALDRFVGDLPDDLRNRVLALPPLL
jgi:ADP-ribose pyrophosphatase